MILASDLVADLQFLVDDENSDRYDFDNDYKPAINGAVRYIMSAFDKAFERGSLSPTIFNELLYGQVTAVTTLPLVDAVKVAITNPLINSETLWRLVGVDPTPVVSGSDYVMAGARLAKFVPFIESGDMNDDPFEPGYSSVATDVKGYSYTHINTITPDATPAQYLVVRPKPPGSVGIIHLRTPTKVVLTSTEFEFPPVLYQPVLMKAYQYMMIQAGKQPIQNIQISDKDVQELVAIFR
jgi:hypothetical protein